MKGGPVEAKVKAGAYGAGTAGVITTALLWLLGGTVWGGGLGASEVSDALAAVPAPVTALLALVVPAVGSWVAGYWAPHTPELPPVLPEHQAEHAA